MTWHVAGIDLSLTNSGVALLRHNYARPLLRNVLSSPVRTSQRNGKPYASLLDRRDRIQHIAARVIAAATDGLDDTELDTVPLFIIEAPFYATANGTASASAHDRAWLWGLVVHLLFKRGIVVEVTTQTLKRYATGKGSGRKAGVLAAMPYMFPEQLIDDDNLADAAVLAAMGARQIGHPVEPSSHRISSAALEVIAWPRFTKP